MGGLNATERRAQAAFERDVLAHIVALSQGAGAADAEQVEQAMGYYRHAAAGNPVQQLLGRRLRGAIANLTARALLDPTAPADTLRATPLGRAAARDDRSPWWWRLGAAVLHGGRGRGKPPAH